MPEKQPVDKNLTTALHFWNSRSKDERRAIIDVIVKQPHIITDSKEYDIETSWEKLKKFQKEQLMDYFEKVILPQRGRQQLRYDGVIEEILPDELSCPICGSKAKQVTTKRGIHYKCSNESCAFDSNRPFDFNKTKRHDRIVQCARLLKELVPELNYVENFPYSPEILFTGEKQTGPLKYDIGVYFMGMKLQRIRLEINQGLTRKQFYDSEYCYVVGRPEVVEYMAKRKGLVAHLLIDEPGQQIGISRMDKVVEICPMKKDNFGNMQYFIEHRYRPALVTFDPEEIRNMMFHGYQKKLFRDVFIF